MKTYKKWDDIFGGTSLRGYLNIDYATLKRVFGLPGEDDGYKTDAQWLIEFDDGRVATIYNYKDGKNYLGNEGTPKTQITDWHIGGHGDEAVYMVKAYLFDYIWRQTNDNQSK